MKKKKKEKGSDNLVIILRYLARIMSPRVSSYRISHAYICVGLMSNARYFVRNVRGI